MRILRYLQLVRLRTTPRAGAADNDDAYNDVVASLSKLCCVGSLPWLIVSTAQQAAPRASN